MFNIKKMILNLACMAALAAPAAAASPGFTGNFSQSAGSVFDGGDYDRTSAIAIDTWTAGGPFVYVVGGSSDNAAGTEYGLIVKYGSDGVMLASDTYRNVKSMFRSVQFDAAGDLAVSGNVDSAFLVVKYNKALSRLNSTSISGGGDGWALASDSQSNLYLAGSGVGGSGWFMKKLNSSLAGTASADFPSGFASGVGVMPDGSVVFVGNLDTGSSRDWHFRRYDQSLSTLLSSATYSVSNSTGGGSYPFTAFDGNGNIYVGGHKDVAGTQYAHLAKFSSAFALLDSTTSATANSVFARPALNPAADRLIVGSFTDQKRLMAFDPSNLHRGASLPSSYLGISAAADNGGYVYVAGDSPSVTDEKDPANDFHTVRYLIPSLPVVGAGFTGNFTQTSGANFDGGDMDMGTGAAFYNSNVYVAGGALPNGGIIIRYNGAGTVLSSATLGGVDGFMRVAANANGIYAVAQGTNTGFVTVKYTPNLVFVSSAVLAGDSSARDLTFDPSGNVYVVGSNMGEGGNNDYKIVEYNSNLAPMGSPKLFDAGGYDEGKGIAYDSGNLYVTGDSLIGNTTYFVTAKFMASTSLVFQSSVSYTDTYVEPDMPMGERLAISTTTHNVYLVGTNGTENGRHILTLRYSQNLLLLSSAAFAGSTYQLGADIKVDKDGYVYTLGKDGSSADHPVLVKYDPSLNFLSNATSVQPNSYLPLAFALDPATGESYVTGFYSTDGSKDMPKADMRTVKLPPLGNGVPGNHSPVLAWAGGGAYENGGLNVVNGTAGNTSMFFVYKVKYTDPDNDPPGAGYPKLYVTNAGIAAAMQEQDPADKNYSAGKIYTYATQLSPGANYGYYFVAQDSNTAPATGVPTDITPGPVVVDAPTLSYQLSNHFSAGINANLVLAPVPGSNNPALAKDLAGNVYTAQTSVFNAVPMLVLTKYNSAGGVLWTRFIPSGILVAKDIAADALGNSYVLSAIGGGSLFITKYDAMGAEVWTNTWSSGNPDTPGAIRVTPDGTVYVASSHSATPSGTKIALAKFNAFGAPVWSSPVEYQSVPGSSIDTANSMALIPGATAFIYVAGNSNLNVPGGSSDGLLAKFVDVGPAAFVNGNAIRYDSPNKGYDTANSVAVDQLGNVYMTGSEERSDLGQGNNIWVAKYDPFGTRQWLQEYNSGSYTNDNGNAIALDNFGNVYVAGQVDLWSSGTGENLWIGEYNSRGVMLLDRHYSPGSGSDNAYGIAVGSASVYVLGSFLNNSVTPAVQTSGLYILPAVSGGGGGAQAAFLAAMEGSNTGSVALSWNYPSSLPAGSSFTIQYSTSPNAVWSRDSAQVTVSTMPNQGDMQNYTIGGLMTGRNPDQTMFPNYMFRVWLVSADGSSTLLPGATSYAKTPFAYDNTMYYGQDRISYLSNVQAGNGTRNAVAVVGDSVYQAFGNAPIAGSDPLGLGFRKYNLNNYVEWTRFFNTASGAYYSVNALLRDNAGNFYAVGGETPSSDATNKNLWIGKFSAAGDLLWSASEDVNGGFDELHGAALDAAGTGLYVAGEFSDSGQAQEILVRKYDVSNATGTSVKWQYTEPGRGGRPAASARGIAVDAAYVYAVATISGSVDNDICVRKIRQSDAAIVSSFTYNSGFGDDSGNDIAVNAAGVYVAGSIATPSETQSIYMAKYQLSLGTTFWALTSGPQGNSEMNSLKLDAAGNVYGAGYETRGDNKDAIYGKLAGTDGAIIWNRSFNDNNAGNIAAYSVQVDTAGRVISALDDNGRPGFFVFPQPSFALQAMPYTVPGSVKLSWMARDNANSADFYIQYSTDPNVAWSTSAAQVTFTNNNMMAGSYQTAAIFGLDNIRDARGMSMVPPYYFKVWVSTVSGIFNLAHENAVPPASAKAADMNVAESMSSFAGDAQLFTVGYNNNMYSPAAGMEKELNGVASDSSGNVYMAANTNWSGSDIFVLKKFNSSGSPVWTRTYTPGEFYNIKAERIAADASGNIYVTGYQRNPVDTSRGKDLFLIKFNSAGSLVLKYLSQKPGDDAGYAVTVAPDGSAVYVAGSSTTANMEDVYVAKFPASTLAAPVWERGYNGSANITDIGYGIALHGNYLYVAGISGESQSGRQNSVVWAGRYSAGNASEPITAYVGSLSNMPASGYDVAVDSSGYVYVAGEAADEASWMNNGVIYRASADLSDFGVTVSTYRGGNPSGSNAAAYGLAMDAMGGIYAVGMEERYDLNQDKNLWIRKFAPDMSELWTQTFNSNNTSAGMNLPNADLGLDVAVDNAGYVYVSGKFGSNGGMYRYKQSNTLAYNPTLTVNVKMGSSGSAATSAFQGVPVTVVPFSQAGGIDSSNAKTLVTNSSGTAAFTVPAGKQYFVALSTQGWIPTIKDQQMDPYGNFFVQLNGDIAKEYILYPRPAGDPAYPLTVTVSSAIPNDSIMAEIFYMKTGEKVAYGMSQIGVNKSSVTFIVPNVSPADANVYTLGITIPNRNVMKSVPLTAAFPAGSSYSVSMSTMEGAIAAYGGFDASVSTNPASLEGVVRDRVYTSPIANATVSIYHQNNCSPGNNPQYDEYETLTDVNGKFSFYDVPQSAMPYQMGVKKAGYSRGGFGGCWFDTKNSKYVYNGVTVSSSSAGNYQEFGLDQATYTFKGIITYNGVPLPNASVMVNGDFGWYNSGSDVYRQNGGIATDANIKTGADGSFTFSSATLNGLLEGGLTLQVSFFGNWTDINQGDNHQTGSSGPDYDDIRIVLSGQRATDLDSVCKAGKVWVLKAADGSCMTAANPDTALTFNIQPAGGNNAATLHGQMMFVTTYTVTQQTPLNISTSAPVTVMAMQQCNGNCNGQAIGFTPLSGQFTSNVATYSVVLSSGISYYTQIVSADWGETTSFDSNADFSSTDTVRMDFTVGKSGVLKGSILLPNGNNFKPFYGTSSGNNDPAAYSANVQVKGTNVDVSNGNGTDDNGAFEFPNLAPGIYDITLQPQGSGFVWAPVVMTGVSVAVGKTTEVKLQLSEGIVVQPQIVGLPDISTPTWSYIIIPVPSGTEMNLKKITDMFFGDSPFAFNYSTATKTWDKKYMLPGQYDFYLMLASKYNPGGGDSSNQTSYDQFGNFIGKVKGVAVQKSDTNPGTFNQPIPVNILGSIGQGVFDGTVKGAKVFTDADIIRIFANFNNEITPLIPAVMIYDSAGDLKGYTAALPAQEDFAGFWTVVQNKDAAGLKSYFSAHPGRFMVPGLPPGRYTAVFSNPNYPPVVKDLELPAEGYAFDFEGQQLLAGSISGTVFVDGSTEPVSNAVVYLKHRIVDKFSKTDNNGVFSFNNLPSGIFRLEVSKDGFVTTGDKTSLSLTDNVNLTLRMAPSASKITGAVYLSKFPSPLTKAGISIVGYDETLNVGSPDAYLPKIAAITDALGGYELTGIIPGHLYKVSAFYSGKLTVTLDVTAVVGDTYMDDIVLKDMPPQIMVKVKRSPDSTSKVDVVISSPKQLVSTPVCKFNPGINYVSTAAVSLALTPGPNNTYLGQFTVSRNQPSYTVYFSAGDNNKMEKTIRYDQTNDASTDQYIQDEAIQGGEVQMDAESEEYSGLELDPGTLSYSTASASASFDNLVGGFFSALPSVRTVKTAKGNLTIEAAVQNLMASEVYNMNLSNASANKPFTLTLKYDKDKGANNGGLRIYQHDDSNGLWNEVPGNYTIDPMLGVVSVDVAGLTNAYQGTDGTTTPLVRKRFGMSSVVNGRYRPSAAGTPPQSGQFAVFTAKPPTGTPAYSSSFEVYNMPNPFNLKTKNVTLSATDIGTLTIANPYPTKGTVIKYNLPVGKAGNLKFVIYNVAGEKVRTISEGGRDNRNGANGVYYSEWDGKNDNGSDCASGVYFLLTYLDGSKLGNKALKMAIIK